MDRVKPLHILHTNLVRHLHKYDMKDLAVHASHQTKKSVVVYALLYNIRGVATEICPPTPFCM